MIIHNYCDIICICLLSVIPRLDRRISGHKLRYKIPWSSHGMTLNHDNI
ncbi:hypothetical protein [Rickettsia asembonensis]|nr:hypothetical protein [Rickettsia asembonensis]